MRKIGLLISLCLCIVFTALPVSAFAANADFYEKPAAEVMQKPDDSSKPLVHTDGGVVIQGTTAPTTSWDLSANDYVIQFVFDSAIYSNVNFSNHGGEFYLDITTSSSKDQPLTVELIEKGKTTPATSALIDTDGSWSVRFYNLDTSKQYYLKFIKIHDGIDVTGRGTVYIK